MKLEIDEKVCKRHHLSPAQVLLLLAIRQDKFKDILQDLYDRQAIVKEFGQTVITQPWSDKVDEILSESVDIEDLEEWYTALARELAQTFPQGKIPGTAFYYRCNNRELVLKLKKFFLRYPEYKPSKETGQRIIEAAKRYNLEMDRDPKYRVLAKYFILKSKPVMDEDGALHNEIVSPLATYLENEGQESDYTGDWLVNTRN